MDCAYGTDTIQTYVQTDGISVDDAIPQLMQNVIEIG